MSPINLFETYATLKVLGLGGAGCNAINRMVDSGIQGVEFVALNTDRQVLERSRADHTLALGVHSTRGLGAGGDPTLGERAAKESEKEIQQVLEGADMVFLAAGMGGGTGTGAAPVVARLARRMGILTVGVVTRPFLFEGPRRKRAAVEGLERLQKEVDTLVVLPNDNILSALEKRTSLQEAFVFADDVLRQGVQGIGDIVLRPGLINVDFADVAAVLRGAGSARMGVGRGRGEKRGRIAAQAAATSPMLDAPLRTARRILVNLTAGPDFTIGEAHEVMEYILQFSDAEDGDITLGHVLKESMADEVEVTLIAADFGEAPTLAPDREVFTQVDRREATVPRTEPAAGEISREELGLAPEPRRRAYGAGEAIQLEEIELDIPSFLRRHRQQNGS